MFTKKQKSKETVNLSPIWITTVKKLEAMFSGDPEIKTEYDNDSVTMNIYVSESTGAKANALSKLIPETITYGNITLTINVIPSNDDEQITDVIKLAFNGNPHFDSIQKSGLPGFEMSYAVFKKEVIQFYNDDLSDYCGNYNGLMADIAKEILIHDASISFCTKNK